jgi:hypothetical protein
MVVLAALIKPQFAMLAVALFAARQWRMGGVAVGGAVFANLAAYLLWPRDIPETIVQSIRSALHYVESFDGLVGGYNVSFAKGLLLIPDSIVAALNGASTVPDGFLEGPRSLIGYGVVVVVVVSVLALGRRVSPVMVGIALLATASLFPRPQQLLLPGFRLTGRCVGGPGSGRPAWIGDLRAAQRPPSRGRHLCECCRGAQHRPDRSAEPAGAGGDRGADGRPGNRRHHPAGWHDDGADATPVADRMHGDHRLVRAQTGAHSCRSDRQPGRGGAA